MDQRNSQDSNEIADALNAAARQGKRRTRAAFATLAILALGTFVVPRVNDDLWNSACFSNARKLLTVRSIVEVEEDWDAEEKTIPPQILSTEKERAEETLNPEIAPEPNILLTDNNQADKGEKLEDVVNFSTDSIVEPLQNQEEAATRDDEERPVVEPPEFPNVDSILNTLDVADEKNAFSSKRAHNLRVFARAANIVELKDQSSKHFAYAANIIGGNAASKIFAFSDAVSRATQTNPLERDKWESSVAHERAEQRGTPLQASYDELPNSTRTIGDRVALAGYQTPNSENNLPTRSEFGVMQTRANEKQTYSNRSSSKNNANDERAILQTRQMLRDAGVIGPYIERWNERSYRATGMIRSADGSAQFFEAYGNEPATAGSSLLQKIRKPN